MNTHDSSPHRRSQKNSSDRVDAEEISLDAIHFIESDELSILNDDDGIELLSINLGPDLGGDDEDLILRSDPYDPILDDEELVLSSHEIAIDDGSIDLEAFDLRMPDEEHLIDFDLSSGEPEPEEEFLLTLDESEMIDGDDGASADDGSGEIIVTFDEDLGQGADDDLQLFADRGEPDAVVEAPQKEVDPIALEDSEIRGIIGVQPKSHQLWQSRCRIHLERIGTAGELIVGRKLNEEVTRLSTVLGAIIVNCDQDPDDIREEINLPAILDRLASTLEDYLKVAPRAMHSGEALDRLKAVETMVTQGTSELEALLLRMRNNDGDDVAIRAQVLSKVFK